MRDGRNEGKKERKNVNGDYPFLYIPNRYKKIQHTQIQQFKVNDIGGHEHANQQVLC